MRARVRMCLLISVVVGFGVLFCSNSISKTKILIWTHTYPPRVKALKEYWIPKFEKAYPEVEVEYAAIPLGGLAGFETKLVTSLSEGRGPSTWTMGQWNFQYYAENNLLSPVNYAAFEAESKEDFESMYVMEPNVFRPLEYEGSYYGIANDLSLMSLYYNKDVFDDAGVAYPAFDVPMTWKEMASVSTKLAKYDAEGNFKRVGFVWMNMFPGMQYEEWSSHMFYPLLRQAGQYDVLVNGKAAANTPAVKKAFQVYQDMIYEYKVFDPSFPVSFADDLALGRVGMEVAAQFLPAVLYMVNPEIRFGVAPYPYIAGGKKATTCYTWTWGVNKNISEEEQKTAWEFVAFVRGKKGEYKQIIHWLNENGYYVPRKKVLESVEFKNYLKENPWYRIVTWTMENYDVDYESHSFDAIGSAIMRTLERVAYDKQDVADATFYLNQFLKRRGY